MIRVLLVDDHTLVRNGMRGLLERGGDIEVVGEAGSGEEAIELVPRYRPDVVIMDVSMPGMGGLEATRKLLRRDPGLRIVVVTVHESGPFPRRFLEAGVAGYLNKGCSLEECRRAVHQAAVGRTYIGQEVAQHLALGRVGDSDGGFGSLTGPEYDVMVRVARGHTTEDTARVLNLSPKTVATYRSRIFKKLGVPDIVHLVHLVFQHAILEPGSTAPTPEVEEPHPARWPGRRRGRAGPRRAPGVGGQR